MKSEAEGGGGGKKVRIQLEALPLSPSVRPFEMKLAVNKSLIVN